MPVNQNRPSRDKHVPPDSKPSQLRCPRVNLPLGERTLLMGILNVTPDSFSDGGKYLDAADAVKRGLELVDEGADIIDVGGESTRPTAPDVEEEEEIRRVVPVIEALAKRIKAPVSVDTRKSAVAKRALEAGAQMINDVSALHHDPAMLAVAAGGGAPLVLMHMRGTPATMHRQTEYKDLMREIEDYLLDAAGRCIDAGLGPDRIVIDPGIGFAKTAEQNLEILANLGKLAALHLALMVGVSRKSFIGRILDLPTEERLEGTAAAVAACVLGGADIVRVHDVREMARVVKVCDAIRAARRK
jgi:dihydropteroate synthase